MAKIMLVEDDNNLREIYEARLLAEGYEIVSAKDGEEALALAVKEKPDLIISDVMMPKISGFDMLDILRSTPETKNTKIIMMTALSQAEDKDRADRLGADRYLVKSQVTLEDVARVAQEVLTNEEAPAVPMQNTNMPPAPSASTPPQMPQQDATTTLSNQSQASADDGQLPPTQQATDNTDDDASTPAAEEAAPKVANQATPETELNNNNPAPSSTPNSIDAGIATAKPAAEEAAELNQQAEAYAQTQQTESAQPSSNETTEQPGVNQTQPDLPNQPAPQPEQALGQQQTIEVKEAPTDDPSTDSTSQATETAEKLANAVNNLLQNNDPQNQDSSPDSASDNQSGSSNPENAVGSKRVIEPLSDPINAPTNINELLKQEEQKESMMQQAPIQQATAAQQQDQMPTSSQENPVISPNTDQPAPAQPQPQQQNSPNPNDIAL
jgi:DNA-binding response OmpR family regulator